MANYTSNTSDKSKGKAIKLLFCGGIGLHLFYVGKIKVGLLRLLFALLFWSLTVSGITDGEPVMIWAGLLLIVAINSVDFFRLIVGKFEDNVGNYLRV